MISHGPKVDSIDALGNTPLSRAAKVGTEAVVRCLMRHGARINGYSDPIQAPFTAACSLGSLATVKYMHTNTIEPADVNYVTPDSKLGTPLNAALLHAMERTAQGSREEIVRYLLEEGRANINIRTKYWSGALQTACLGGTVEMVRVLIERYHAYVNVSDDTGRTPLHMALYRTREHVELLLEHGADLGAVYVIQRNALHYGVLSGQLDIVKLVLDKLPGLVNEPDDHGLTPLLWALRLTDRWGARRSQMRDIIKELIDRGAHRLVRGVGVIRTWTPMQVADYYSWSEEVTELFDEFVEEEADPGPGGSTDDEEMDYEEMDDEDMHDVEMDD
ncbi:ankyrin repeat-containing domain protein [Xylariaceae sp. FL0594]|nr:ankyrin repeat-containing domain protein [Xylariaceae sp. FL0594]